jgi:hypothetical protein
MDKHILVVLTNAEEGEDEAFNDWYTNRHVPDVLKLKGMKAAQRFRLADTSAPQEAPYKYLAIYEVGPEDLETGVESLQWQRDERADAEAAGREPVVPLSPAMQEERVSWWYTPITGRDEAQPDGG